jgi:signal transduction histidine kinase
VAEGAPTGAATADRAPIRVRVASSVRFRLTVTVVLVVGLSLFGGGTLLVNWVEATLVNDLKVRNEQILESMAASITRGRIPTELFGSVADLTGELDQERTNELFGDDVDAQQVISTTYFYMDGDIPQYVRGVDADGRLAFFRRREAPVSDPRSTIEVTRDIPTLNGVITLHAVSSTEEIRRSVNALSAGLWLGLPVLVIGAGFMTWLITGRTLAPVGVMTRRVRELSATTLDARVPVPPTDDEIAQLARTMNEMLDRLQQASMTQRQFVSDASHELRSPVASIRAQLETALRYPDDVDWPQVARIVLAEDARLEHLVGNLLAMARVEEGRLGPRADVDLDELVMAQTPRLTGVRVDLSGVSAGRVWGNLDELTSVVRNLLDNAARHAASTVTVGVRETGPWVVLTVDDDGPGVPPGDRERVFERFARLQEGRSRDQGGTGLGLALSRRIVEHHGGRIHVEEAPGGGARFVVSLPSSSWTGAGASPASPADVVEGPGAATTATPAAGAAGPGPGDTPGSTGSGGVGSPEVDPLPR